LHRCASQHSTFRIFDFAVLLAVRALMALAIDVLIDVVGGDGSTNA
jgi:hypothetical protein